MSNSLEKCIKLKEASYILPTVSTKSKNDALILVTNSLKKNLSHILLENQKDIQIAKQHNMKESLIDRLRLNEDRMQGIIDSIDTIN